MTIHLFQRHINSAEVPQLLISMNSAPSYRKLANLALDRGLGDQVGQILSLITKTNYMNLRSSHYE